MFKTVGVAAAWVLGNFLRLVLRRPYRPYSDIWNGEDSPDYLARMNHNLIYFGIGAVVIGIFIFLTLNIFT